MVNKTQVAAVVVVIIVIVAIVAAVLLTRSDDDKVEIDSQLLVYGNADGDYKVDQEDLDLINNLLKTENQSERDAFLEEYPLADANYDGSLTQADADLVQKIVNGESCTVYHYNSSNVQDYVVSTKWPVKSALATASANQCWLMTMAGITDMIHGISYSSSSPPDSTLFPTFSAMPSIGSSSTNMPVDNASTYISTYGVTAIITDRTESTLDRYTVEVQYEEMGVDIVRVNAALVDANEYCQQLFLLGFLFQTVDQCKDIAEWWISLQNEIDSKLEGVPKVTAITSNGNVLSGDRIWISGGTSDYVDVLVHAGAIYALDDAILTDYDSGAYFSPDQTWLYNYQFDYIVHIKTNNWYSDWVDDTERYDSLLWVYENTQAYQNGNAYVIVGDAPIPIRVAYAAVVMYPSIFSESWADALHQEFFDLFTDLNLDLSGMHFIISYDMAHPS